MRTTIVLIVEAGCDPELTREAVCDALAEAGLDVELVAPLTIAHAATMTFELGQQGDVPTLAREARRSPSRRRSTSKPTERASKPAARVAPPPPKPLPPERRARVSRETRNLAAELVEGRPASKPRTDRRPPPGGRGTRAFSAPPMRSAKSEGLEAPDLERARDGSGLGLGTVGQSPFDD